MGYSHYHIQKRTFTDSEWSAIQDAVTAMIAAWPLARGPLSSRVDESIISINGIGVGEHETFILERQLPAISGVRHANLLATSGWILNRAGGDHTLAQRENG